MFTGLSGDNHNTILPALLILDPNFLVNDWFVNIKSSPYPLGVILFI